jgi:hypothetical protein
MNTSMNPQLESKFRRIEQSSALLKRICTGLVVAVIVVAAVATVSAFAGRLTSVNYYGGTIPLANLTATGRAIVAIVMVMTGAIAVKALLHLRRLSANYSRRQIFTSESAVQIRQFGISCILWGLVKAVWAFLPMIVLSQRPASVPVTVDTVAIGVAIIAISWFAEMAATIREENDLTI